jgi:hypothetical protein
MTNSAFIPGERALRDLAREAFKQVEDLALSTVRAAVSQQRRNRPANSPWRDEGQRSLRIAMLAVLMLKAVASKGPPHQCQ